MTIDDCLALARRKGITATDGAIELARMVLAIAGADATPKQTSAAYRRLRFAQYLYVTGKVNEFGGPRNDPPQNWNR